MSDERLKANIEDCPSMLEKCKKLQVRSFTLKKYPNKQSYGFIAQEVLEQLTEEEKTQFQIIGLDKQIDDETKIETEYYTLFPQQLFIMNFKATQEIADIQDSLSQRIVNLKTNIQITENSLNDLIYQNTLLLKT